MGVLLGRLGWLAGGSGDPSVCPCVLRCARSRCCVLRLALLGVCACVLCVFGFPCAFGLCSVWGPGWLFSWGLVAPLWGRLPLCGGLGVLGVVFAPPRVA